MNLSECSQILIKFCSVQIVANQFAVCYRPMVSFHLTAPILSVKIHLSEKHNGWAVKLMWPAYKTISLKQNCQTMPRETPLFSWVVRLGQIRQQQKVLSTAQINTSEIGMLMDILNGRRIIARKTQRYYWYTKNRTTDQTLQILRDIWGFLGRVVAHFLFSNHN